MTPHPVTLTTDFGTRDAYVASMKGVLLSLVPGISIVDMTHEIGAQDVREAAFLIREAARHFPGKTVHVVVVDPGVGTSRRILCLATARGVFLAPDNGVLTLVLRDARGDETTRLYSVTARELFREEVSSTFHGRDVFAPVAAHLARGLDPSAVGEPIDDPILLQIPEPTLDPAGREIRGEIVRIDRFGNLISNIRGDLLPDRKGCTVEIGEHRVLGLVASYGALPEGGLGALVESTGHLELALRDGDAARALEVRLGAEIRVRW